MNKNENSGSSRYQSIVSLSKDDRLLAQFRGHGPSLIRAQDNASSAAWNNLKPLFNGSIQVPKSKKKRNKLLIKNKKGILKKEGTFVL